MSIFAFYKLKTNNMDVLQTYFSQHADELIAKAGMKKYEFAEKMGVKRQNLQKTIIETRNIEVLNKVSSVLNVPLSVLIGIDAPKESSVNGYIEIEGIVHKIKSKQDLINLANDISK